jgi:hypothetical protein
MPNPSPAVSPFETVTSKKSGKISKRTIIISAAIFLFLILGVFAGVLLVKQQQTIQEKAAASVCPVAQSCPVSGQPSLLRNCNTPNADGSPQELSCLASGNVGQISACGPQSYCCPSLGASWTTDLTLCTTPSPTPIVTPTPFATETPTASSSATPTATTSATPLAQRTSRPIPVTGTDWPTLLGVGIGGAAIIGAILLAI